MKLKHIGVSAGLALLLTPLIPVGPAQAGIFDQVVQGFKTAGTAAGFRPTASGAPPVEFVPAFLTYIAGFATLFGVFFAILLIYGGWVWMNAHGNEDKVKKAKGIIIQALIGLGIIIAARIIVELVIIGLTPTVSVGGGT
jgi:hypothetical protein